LQSPFFACSGLGENNVEPTFKYLSQFSSMFGLQSKKQLAVKHSGLHTLLLSKFRGQGHGGQSPESKSHSATLQDVLQTPFFLNDFGQVVFEQADSDMFIVNYRSTPCQERRRKKSRQMEFVVTGE
jgi:hypothetical protein